MNKYSKLVSNTFIFALGTFSSKLLVYFLMPIYTDILSPDEFNKVELITSTANLLIPIVAVCIAESVIRFGLDKASNKAQVFSAGIYTVLIGYLIFLLFIPLVNLNPFTTGYTHLIYLFVLGSSLKGVCSQYIRAKGYVKLYAVDGLFSTAMVIAFNILGLVVFKLGITGFVLATILSDFISAICLFLFASLWRDIRIKIDSRLWKSMIIYSLPLIPNTIFFWITSLSDRYIVTFFEGDTVNGLYSIAYKIPAILTAVSTIFMQAWHLSAFTDDDNDAKAKFYSNVFSAYQSLMFLAAAAIILMVKPFTYLLMKPEYHESWRFVPILILSVVFSCFAVFFSSIYMVEKKNKMTMLTTFMGAVINISLNFALIPVYGANGAAFATLVSYIAVFIFRSVHSRAYIKVKVGWGRIIVNMLLLSLQTAVALIAPADWILMEIAIIIVLIIVNIEPLIGFLFTMLDGMKKKNA